MGSAQHDPSAALQAGIGATDITPTGPIRMAGWASRDRASEGVSHPIHAKALALRDAAGHTGVWVTADILGYSRTMADTLERRLQERYGLSQDQIILGSSHNHSGPMVGDLLHLYFDLQREEKATVARYTEQLLERIVGVVGQALADLAPAELSMGFGLAGFGVNRRRARGADTLHRPQAVDHDVPVLAVRAPDGALRAILFGYGLPHHGRVRLPDQRRLRRLRAELPGSRLSGRHGDVRGPGAAATSIRCRAGGRDWANTAAPC